MLDVLTLGWLLVATDSSPAVRVRRAVHFYEVHGTSVQELRAAMDQAGPFDMLGDGSRYDSFTSWYVGWNYRCEPSAGAYRLTDVGVRLEITLTLPRWIELGSASRALADRWRAHLAALETHEAGHEEAGRWAAQLAHKSLIELSPQSTCETLLASANRLADGAVAEARRRERAHDRETGHGRTQGASFP